MAVTLHDGAVSEVRPDDEDEADHDHDEAMSEEQPRDEDEGDYEGLDEIEEQVAQQRWQCDVCYERKAGYDTRWMLSSDHIVCRHSFCT
jgi:hypothetical protein